MNWLQNMKVGSKIVLLIATLLACILCVAGLGMLELRTLDQQSDIMYEKDLLALLAAKEANIEMINMSREVRNLALVGLASGQHYVEAYMTSRDKVRDELTKVRERIDTPEAVELYDKTLAAFENVVPQYEEIVRHIGRRTSDETFGRLRETRTLSNTVDNLMSELGDHMAAAAAERNAAMSRSSDQALLASVAVLVAALALGAILGLLVKGAIANPLVQVAAKAARVAGGDLDISFAMQREDELGDLSRALDQMAVNLRGRIAEAEQKSLEAAEQTDKAREATELANAAREKAESGRRAILEAAENVERVVNRLSAASEELSAQIEQSSRNTDMQRDRVASSAGAMAQMNATVLDVARNAGVAAEGSNRARQKAQHGEEIVGQSVEAIGTVQNDTRELRRNMEDLGRQAEAIGTIMTVISDIADQTNLLALNAAIEAARAGEAGRGFAVVADEVRKLAEKTMSATKEVGEAIRGIQDGTRQSVGTVERTSENLDATTELVKRSGEALADIVREVIETADQVQSIAAAAEEQSSSSDQITRSLDEINNMADENAAAMQQSSQAVADLATQSQELQHLVNALRQG